MSRNKSVERLIARLLVDAAALGCILVAPWGVAFAGIALASAVFPWYVEALAVGFVASAVSGLSVWKAFVAIGGMIVAAEWIKCRFEPRQWFSYIPIAMAAASAGGVIFFLAL